jgi:hypothetical protein
VANNALNCGPLNIRGDRAERRGIKEDTTEKKVGRKVEQKDMTPEVTRGNGATSHGIEGSMNGIHRDACRDGGDSGRKRVFGNRTYTSPNETSGLRSPGRE